VFICVWPLISKLITGDGVSDVCPSRVTGNADN